MRIPAAIAALAALAAGPALAQNTPGPGGSQTSIVTQVQSANDLAAVCDPSWGGMARFEAIAYCQGFITAAGQFHARMNTGRSAGGRSPIYCLPQEDGPTVAQAGYAFANWTRQNSQHGSEPAIDGLMRWAQTTYPCSNQNRSARRTGGRS